MTTAQMFIEKGKLEGIAIGQAKGKNEGIAIGEAKGRNEGIAIGEARLRDEKTTISKALKLKGMPVEQISEVTGLSVSDIKKL